MFKVSTKNFKSCCEVAEDFINSGIFKLLRKDKQKGRVYNMFSLIE